MLEILQYVTSDFWIFLGCFMFTTGFIMSVGWSINAMLIGIRGKKCDDLNIFN